MNLHLYKEGIIVLVKVVLWTYPILSYLVRFLCSGSYVLGSLKTENRSNLREIRCSLLQNPSGKLFLHHFLLLYSIGGLMNPYIFLGGGAQLCYQSTCWRWEVPPRHNPQASSSQERGPIGKVSSDFFCIGIFLRNIIKRLSVSCDDGVLCIQ